MFYWIVAITATFMLQIHNVFFANIFFFLWVLIRTIAQKPNYRFDKKGLLLFSSYLVWVFFSMLVFFVQYLFFEIRNVVQFIYNFQYLLLIVYGSIDKMRLRKCMHFCSYILAFVIIVLWITKTGMMSVPILVVHNRMWASEYLGGWPNSIVLPLVFGIFMEANVITRENILLRFFKLGVLLFAILLCTSRTGYIGAALVIGYKLFIEKKVTKSWLKVIKCMVSGLLIVVIVFSTKSIISSNDLGGRLLMVDDRLDIVRDSFYYFVSRPITGYGGNTLDVIYVIVGKTLTGYNWGHTHNTILELLIRHGFVGMLFFLLFVIRVAKRITNKDDKAMYWILWALSVLQIFYKDFVFLLLLYMLIPSTNDRYDSLDDSKQTDLRIQHENTYN